jgi:hypothetical protein
MGTKLGTRSADPRGLALRSWWKALDALHCSEEVEIHGE